MIISKLNSIETANTKGSETVERKHLNAKNITASESLRQALSAGQYLLTLHMKLHSAMLAKSWNIFGNYKILDLPVVKQRLIFCSDETL